MMYKHSLEMLHERQRNLIELIKDTLQWGDVPDLLFATKRLCKQMQCLKAAAQAPLQEQLIKIRNDFTGLESSIEQHEETLKARVLKENRDCNQRRDSAIQEANDAYARNDLAAVQQAMLKASDAELKLPSGIGLRQQVRLEVTDKSLIPIEYLKTDDAKIRSAKQEIPGVIKRHELIVAVAAGEAEYE